jgi:hypothetical protein
MNFRFVALPADFKSDAEKLVVKHGFFIYSSCSSLARHWQPILPLYYVKPVSWSKLIGASRLFL